MSHAERADPLIPPQLEDKNNPVIDTVRYHLEGARTNQSYGFEFMSTGRSVIIEMTERFGTPGGLPY